MSTVFFYTAADITLSGASLVATKNANAGTASVALSQDTRGATKVYAEIQLSDAFSSRVGIGLQSANLTASLGQMADSFGMTHFGSLFYNNAVISGTSLPGFSANDWLGVAIDRTALTLQIRNVTTNTSWSPTVDVSALGSVNLCVGTSVVSTGDVTTANFDGTFAGTPPDGSYTRWDGTNIQGTFIGFFPPDVTISNGNLTATKTANDGQYSIVLSETTRGATKVYAEMQLTTVVQASGWMEGIALSTEVLANNYLGGTLASYGWSAGFVLYNNNVVASISATGVDRNQGDWIGVAVDRTAHTLQLRDITTSMAWCPPISISALGSADICAGIAFLKVGEVVSFNFDSAFLGTPPDGTYTRWDGSSIAGGGPSSVFGSLHLTEAIDTIASTGTVPNVIGGSLNLSEVLDTLSSVGAIKKTFFNPAMTSSAIVLSNTNLTMTEAAVSVIYLVDAITPKPTAAWSTRRVKSGATNSIQLCNSNGTSTQTIGFNGSDDLDQSAVNTFYAANASCANCHGMYDQSGSGHDLVGGVGSAVLKWSNVNSGAIATVNSNPAIYFSEDFGRVGPVGSSIYLSDIMTASAFTIIMTFEVEDLSSDGGQTEYGFLNDTQNGYFGSAIPIISGGTDMIRAYLYDGANEIINETPVTIGDTYAVITQLSAGIFKLWVNGGSLAASKAAGNIQVMNYAHVALGGIACDLKMLDLLVYNTALSAADLNTLATASNVINGNFAQRAGVAWTTLV